MAQLVCDKVLVGYEGKAVTQEISFSVEQGMYLCIVGENGSGKTSLIRSILHLQPVISGQIVFGDGVVAREIGYLPQQTIAQRDFPCTVTEVVQSGCLNRCGMRPFYNKSDKKNARTMMERLRIADLANKCYRELSGGQQQRVLLSRALCATGKLLLLDEPAAGLDPRTSLELYEWIAAWNRDEKITVIMVTHDIAAVKQYADHVLHIGASVFYGTKEAYFASGLN